MCNSVSGLIGTISAPLSLRRIIYHDARLLARSSVELSLAFVHILVPTKSLLSGLMDYSLLLHLVPVTTGNKLREGDKENQLS